MYSFVCVEEFLETWDWYALSDGGEKKPWAHYRSSWASAAALCVTADGLLSDSFFIDSLKLLYTLRHLSLKNIDMIWSYLEISASYGEIIIFAFFCVSTAGGAQHLDVSFPSRTCLFLGGGQHFFRTQWDCGGLFLPQSLCVDPEFVCVQTKAPPGWEPGPAEELRSMTRPTSNRHWSRLINQGGGKGLPEELFLLWLKAVHP